MFDRLKNLLQGKINEEAQHIATQTPDFSKTDFNSEVDPTAYSKIRSVFDDKYLDLIIKPDEDPEMDKKLGTSEENNKPDNQKSKSKDKAEDFEPKNKEDDKELFRSDFDKDNEELVDPDTGELIGKTLNNLSPSEIAEEAVVDERNERAESGNTENLNVLKTLPNRQKRLTRREYRQLHEQVAKDNMTSTESVSAKFDHKAVINVDNKLDKNNFDSLETSIPPENLNQDYFDPTDYQENEEENSDLQSNDYKPMNPRKEDKIKVSKDKNDFYQKWLQFKQTH